MIVIRAGRFIDGTGAAPRENVALLVEDKRIVEVLDGQQAGAPDGAQTLDAAEYTVMPGMIDAHVHVVWSGDPADPLEGKNELVQELPGSYALRAYAHAKRDLEAGFTTLRDMLSFDFADISLRDAIEGGLVDGPRISACGYGLTSTGGHMDHYNGMRGDVALPYWSNIIDTPEEARKAVRFLVRMGVDHIKINVGRGYQIKGRGITFYPEMRRDVLETVIEEAHTAGRRVAGHSLGSDGEYWAVEAGIDSLEHAHFIDERTIQAMAEHGTYLVPTMTHCARNYFMLRETLPEDQREKNLVFNAYESMYRVIPRARELGVPITTGTDAGAGNVPHGCNAMEIELLTTVGMNPLEAIHAGTGRAAALLDMADLTGTLTKGRFADLLFVRGDPLADVRLLQNQANIAVVMTEGRVVVDRRPQSN